MLKHSKLWIMWKIVRSLHLFVVIVLIAVVLQAVRVVPIAVPSSNCYALDNSSHIVDFSSWIGRLFEYEGKDSDLVVRFCKDVESRSQSGYIDFGRFDKFNYFVAGSGHVDFVQGFYNGDLVNCEHSFDKLGRTSQVNIICGDCLHRRCKDGLGCICNITYDSSCRVLIDLAIPCEKPGLRVFKGFTVGFHPRSWEIVYNGMTNFGYEKPHQDFRFKTEEAHVSLYMTAIASISSLVKKPIIKVFPEKGLKVSLSGSGASGNPPTTLSPTMLNINWRCEVSGDTPYEVMITIPIEGYEPIQFFLTKTCEYRQIEEGDSTEGWAIFGMISCTCLVLSSLLCCGGFIYKTQVEGQRGIDAVPGITLISTCLETVSGGGQSYRRAKDLDCAFAGQCPTSSSQGTWAPSERKYGSI